LYGQFMMHGQRNIKLNLRIFGLYLKSNNHCALASNFRPTRSLLMNFDESRREERFYSLENEVRTSACP